MTDPRKRFDDLRRNGQIAYDDLETLVIAGAGGNRFHDR
jgi:hypothetical protein